VCCNFGVKGLISFVVLGLDICFKRNDKSIAQIEVEDKIITEPQDIVEAFANHFSFVFNSSFLPHSLRNSNLMFYDFF
jgi:hypothetical protein